MFAHRDVAHIDDFVAKRGIFFRINSYLAPCSVSLVLVLDVRIGPTCPTTIAVQMLAVTTCVAQRAMRHTLDEIVMAVVLHGR